MGFIAKFLLRVLVNGAAIYSVALFLPGFQIANEPTAILFGAVIMALVHAFVRPILKILSFPLLILTLGLFNIVINLILLWLADLLSASITVEGLLTYLIASAIFGIVNSVF